MSTFGSALSRHEREHPQDPYLRVAENRKSANIIRQLWLIESLQENFHSQVELWEFLSDDENFGLVAVGKPEAGEEVRALSFLIGIVRQGRENLGQVLCPVGIFTSDLIDQDSTEKWWIRYLQQNRKELQIDTLFFHVTSEDDSGIKRLLEQHGFRKRGDIEDSDCMVWPRGQALA